MASLDRLIELAKKTGDRLIVHDPYGDRDMVIMDVDQYMQVVRGKDNIRQLSGKELVQKVNRDIAIWHSDKESQEQEAMWQLLEQELEQRGGTVADDIEEWHPIGDIVQKQLNAVVPPVPQPIISPKTEIVRLDSPEIEQDGVTEVIYEIPVEEPPRAPVSSPPLIEWEGQQSPRLRMHEGLADYTRRSVEQPKMPIPQKSEDLGNFFESGPVDGPESDDPVFFEEPV